MATEAMAVHQDTPFALHYRIQGVVPAEFEGSGDALVYLYTPEATVIRAAQWTMKIDYGAGWLYRYDTGTSCFQEQLVMASSENPGPVPLENSLARSREEDLGTVHHTVSSLASVQLQGYPTRHVEVVWGEKARRQRRADEDGFLRYGLKFTPIAASVWTTTMVDRYDDIVRLARKRGEVYAANPLLRRLDILALVSSIGGVPVGIDWGGGTLVLTRIERKAELPGQLPESCQHPPSVVVPQ